MELMDLHLGMRVVHPQYGDGVVKSINEFAAEILFKDGRKPVDPKASDLVPADARAQVHGLSVPLDRFVRETVDALVDRLGIEKPDGVVHELGTRWRGGKIVLHPSDATLQTKEIEIDGFFHKIVMVRNQLRVLEQKVNSNEALSSAEKFDWQQYITRCYGSLTTFNLLFKEKEQGF